jgi:hypothetical protein
MPPISDVVDITITRETKPATRSSFGIALVIGDSGVLPDKASGTLTIDAQLVVGCTVNGKINGVAITPVPWNTDNDTTMADLATEILSHAEVASAVASDFGAVGYDNRITWGGQNVDTAVVMSEFVSTGGATNPTFAIVNTSFLRTKQYTSLAAVAEDFATTDPEYIAATAFFEQSPNPGVLKIGRVDAAEDWDDALDAIIAVDNTWYGLAMTERTQADVEDVAAWVEDQGTNHSNPKLFATASDDANILSAGSSSDVAAVFATAEYDRAITLYHQDAGTTYPEVAWVAEVFSLDPGTATWKFKTLDNFTASVLTDGQRAAGLAKFANLYETYGDVDITHEGQVASSEFIDIIRGIDWLESTMASNIFAILANAPKIAYTNAGIAAVEAEVRGALDDAITAGVLREAPDDYEGQPYRVTTKKVSEISQADRSNRLLPSDAITFDAKVAGAIHKVEISGTVAV